jgi:hypothetical protein
MTLITQRRKALFWTVPLLMSSWLSLAFFDWIPPINVSIDGGYLMGCLLAHATLAAAWAVFGSRAFYWRLPLSLVWILLLGIAMAIYIASQGFNPYDRPRLVATLLLGQWLILQLAFWILKAGFQFRLRNMEGNETDRVPRWQFGTRHLLLATAVAGVIVAIGCKLITSLPARYLQLGDGTIFYLFLTATATLTSPLVLFAALRERRLAPGIFAVLAICCATPIEELLYTLSNGAGSVFYLMLATNSFTSGFVFAVATILRLCGYRLVRSRTNSESCAA